MDAPAVPQCQLVTGDGHVSEQLEGFVEEAGVCDWGSAYQVVAIMGPQSSGKSTLLNHLFGTRFVEMDALSGRGQTTQGVWAARAAVDETEEGTVNTLVFDLEARACAPCVRPTCCRDTDWCTAHAHVV